LSLIAVTTRVPGQAAGTSWRKETPELPAQHGHDRKKKAVR
jgi:hypothetical protein